MEFSSARQLKAAGRHGATASRDASVLLPLRVDTRLLAKADQFDAWRTFMAATIDMTVDGDAADGFEAVQTVWNLGSLALSHARMPDGGQMRHWRHLKRDPHISICVDEGTPPYAYVIIEGSATLSEDPDELLRWATVIGGRYMGVDRAEEFGNRNGVPGEYLVRVTPTKVIARADIAGYD